MRLLLQTALGTLAFFSIILLSTPFAIAAENPFNKACGGGVNVDSSTICRNQVQVNNPITGAGSIFEKVINLVTIVTGIVAVFVIIISGIRFATSSGDSNSVNQAKNTILYTVIGLVVLLLARSIIIFVLNRL